MSKNSETMTDDDLHAYVDGQLDASQLVRVEEYLAKNPEAIKRIEQFQLYNQGLHNLFDETLDEEIPSRLTRHTPGRMSIPLRNAAAIFLALNIGVMGGWFVRDVSQESSRLQSALVEDAMTSHVVYVPEVRHPVEVDSGQDKHLFAWLTKRLKTEVKAPELTSLGYSLLGGRLLGSEGEPAAQFMYENNQGRRLTLFLRHRKNSESETAFRFASRGEVRGFYWIDGDLGYALIGDTDKTTLSDAAHLVYTALN